MTNNSSSRTLYLIVIGGLLVLILGNLITDIMTPPEAKAVAYDEKVCPQSISFGSCGDKTTDFTIELQNAGDDDGSLYVTLSSNSLLIRANDEEDFKLNSSKVWFVDSKDNQKFNFNLKQKDNSNYLNNITIFYTYGSYEKVLGIKFSSPQYNGCCNYQKDKHGYNFRYVNQTCP